MYIVTCTVKRNQRKGSSLGKESVQPKPLTSNYCLLDSAFYSAVYSTIFSTVYNAVYHTLYSTVY